LFDPAERHDEEALFHAWNEAQDSGRPIVMVVDEREWNIALPDLRTRIAVTPRVRIDEPDDALFSQLIELLFADRGLVIPPDVLRYITQRVYRDYLTAERVVEAIDRFAIAERARLTVPTARRALIAAGIIDARGEA
jgi:chromosomal replication initiation ATPase DnaA